MTFVLATGNKGKAGEFSRMLDPLGVRLTTPAELGIAFEVEETGSTFMENARLKAEYLFHHSGLPTIADDSGLTIDAMDGRPGVATARYGGESLPYPQKFQLIFKELENAKQGERTAAFVCAICCVIDKDTTIEVEGFCQGEIGFAPSGSSGFGYDPIFYVDGRSFAEFSPEEKDALSHRGIALRRLVEALGDQLKED